MPSKAVGKNGLRKITQQKKSDPIRPDEGSSRLAELEETPDGVHRFVAFEAIVPVAEWI